jgi:hypothetical protein
VYCYRFDPERRERRHCLVAAYEREREMLRRIDVEAARLEERRTKGTAHPSEHLTGSFKPAGHKQYEDERRLRERLSHLGEDRWVNYRP